VIEMVVTKVRKVYGRHLLLMQRRNPYFPQPKGKRFTQLRNIKNVKHF